MVPCNFEIISCTFVCDMTALKKRYITHEPNHAAYFLNLKSCPGTRPYMPVRGYATGENLKICYSDVPRYEIKASIHNPHIKVRIIDVSFSGISPDLVKLECVLPRYQLNLATPPQLTVRRMRTNSAPDLYLH